MTDQTDIKSPADMLAEIRSILAAISREAGHRGIDEIVDLAGRADALTTQLLQRDSN